MDQPRNVEGATSHIIESLQAHGLYWDQDIQWQNEHLADYQQALDELIQRAAAYPCACSRKSFTSGIYPGTCRQGLPANKRQRSIRLLTDSQVIRFTDLVQGQQQQVLEQEVGDFVIRRADGLFAYQLTVVVEDRRQAITEVVRGSDLLDSTSRQIHLQRQLGYATPRYMHLPTALDQQGNKLSKQTGAVALEHDRSSQQLHDALGFLGQSPPAELIDESVTVILDWAIEHWQSRRIPRRNAIPESRYRDYLIP